MNKEIMSQGDIEARTELKRCYISRVENGHTVPTIETLEKLARALEVPMYQVFCDGEEPPQVPAPPEGSTDEWGNNGDSGKFFRRLRELLRSGSLFGAHLKRQVHNELAVRVRKASRACANS